MCVLIYYSSSVCGACEADTRLLTHYHHVFTGERHQLILIRNWIRRVGLVRINVALYNEIEEHWRESWFSRFFDSYVLSMFWPKTRNGLSMERGNSSHHQVNIMRFVHVFRIRVSNLQTKIVARLDTSKSIIREYRWHVAREIQYDDTKKLSMATCDTQYAYTV